MNQIVTRAAIYLTKRRLIELNDQMSRDRALLIAACQSEGIDPDDTILSYFLAVMSGTIGAYATMVAKPGEQRNVIQLLGQAITERAYDFEREIRPDFESQMKAGSGE